MPYLRLLLLGSVFSLCLLVEAPAEPKKPEVKKADPRNAEPKKAAKEKKPAPPNEIVQGFPKNDAQRTAWKVNWATQTGYGLYIQDAWFKKSPTEPWLQVLGDVRLAEMFVPYNSGSPRFWDVSYNFGLLRMTAAEAGPFGEVLGNPPTVVKEIRDRGVMWLDAGNKPTRRGQMLTLWAALDAANYRYVTEFSFHDDGTVACRVGSTGRNYASREFEGHMHNGLWRVDVNLGGLLDNSVQVMEHLEPFGQDKGKAQTVHRPFNNGKEGFEDYDAGKFSMISVVNDRRRNVRKQPYTYDVVTSRMGNARHFGGDKEDCTLHDFWVTRNRPGEIYYTNLPKYVARGESITETDVVLWISTAGHHDPRSEDGEMQKGNLVGATPIMWTGFELRPRNIWDRSPLYP